MRTWSLLLIVLLTCSSQGQEPVEIDDPATELRPGLAAEYRSVTTSAAFTTIELKPSFTWDTSSPHPRIPSGPFEGTWKGLIDVRTKEPIRWSALISGEITVHIGKQIVLQGQGK